MCMLQRNFCHNSQSLNLLEDPNISCITNQPGFLTVCLDVWVLQTAYYQYRQEQNPNAAATRLIVMLLVLNYFVLQEIPLYCIPPTNKMVLGDNKGAIIYQVAISNLNLNVFLNLSRFSYADHFLSLHQVHRQQPVLFLPFSAVMACRVGTASGSS